MKKNYKFLYVIVFALISNLLIAQNKNFTYTDNWGTNGYNLVSSKISEVDIIYSINNFSVIESNINSETLNNISLPGVFLFNDAGMPDLPGDGRMIAVPVGSKPIMKIVRYETELIKNVKMAPAPIIPLDTDAEMIYEKDAKIYSTDKFYPENPIQISEIKKIRGVDFIMLGITPFQYNPVTEELLVYRDIEVNISFEGGKGIFGDNRLRNIYWESILEDALLNYSSLPAIDYSSKSSSVAGQYEYLIITPDNPDFIAKANEIKEFRLKQGILTGVVTTTEIGGNTTTAIESYINNAYNNWSTPPAAVLLLADYGTTGNTIISPIWDNYCASDNIYADVDQDQLPDIVFARITANNLDQLNVMISKFINYETSPPVSADFYNHPITALGWQTERWFQLCSETIGGFWKNSLDKNPVRINAVYEGNPASDPWSTATNTSTVLSYFGPSGLNYIPANPSGLGGWTGGTPANVNTAINSGSFMLQHRDHGFEQGWGEPGYESQDINGLTNTDLTFIMSVNCLTGKYNYSSEVFAEKFHRYTYNGNPAGALGVLAASETSYSFVNDAYVWGAYDNMWPNFMPGSTANPQNRMILPAFANVAGKNFLYQSSWPYNTNNKEVTYNLFHLHGDAYLNVYSEVPQNLAVTSSDVHVFSVLTLDVNVEQGAYIAVTYFNADEQQTVILGTALSNGGVTSIQLSECPPPATNLLLTVTKQNYFRYTKNILVIAPNGPYVICNNFSINDGTSGNNQAEFSETFNLDIVLKNVGSQNALGISATLSETDEYVTLGANNLSVPFSDILTNQLSPASSGKFEINIANNIPDQHLAKFSLTVTDNVTNNTYTSQIAFKVNAPELSVSSNNIIVDDSAAPANNDGILDPGETANIKVNCSNLGHADVSNVIGNIACSNVLLTLNSISTSPVSLNVGQSQDFIFNVSASENFIVGTSVNLDLNFTAGTENQYSKNVTKTMVVGFVPTYCVASGGCDEYISNVQIGTISNNSGSCSSGGYANYKNISTDVNLGATYPITVNIGTAYSSDKVYAWVDWNYNGVFDTGNETFPLTFSMSKATGIAIGNIVVPNNILPRHVTMRVRVVYNSTPTSCGISTYGETEDYTLNITPVNGGVATAIQTVFCETGSTTINLTDYLGENIQWQISLDGTVWENIEGANLNSYFTNTLNQNCMFRAKISSLGFNPVYSSTVSITVYDQTEADFTYELINEKDLVFTNNSTNANSYSWDFGDGLTSIEINPSHSYLEYGNYTVVLTANNLPCTDTQTETVMLVNNIDNLFDLNFKIYPNPSNGILNITTDLDENIQILITDITGKEVYNQVGNSKNINEIDLTNCISGVYVLKIICNEKIFIKQFIIN